MSTIRLETWIHASARAEKYGRAGATANAALRCTKYSINRTDGGGCTVEAIFTAPYSQAAYALSKFSTGDKISVGGITDVPVTSIKLETRDGGIVELVVRAASDEGTGGTGGVSGRKTLEIDWCATDRPLAQHSRYATLFTPGERNADLAALQRWLALSDDIRFTSRRAALEAPTENALQEAGWDVSALDPGNDQSWAILPAGQGGAREYAEKILRGMESFTDFNPVVRQSETAGGFTGLGSTAAGKIDTPPGRAPGGYVYIKTADRYLRNGDGTWTHDEEWTGYDSVDEDIYT